MTRQTPVDRAALHALLAGGVYVADSQPGIQLTDALIRLAAVQAKAVAVALSHGRADDEEFAHVTDFEFTTEDAVVVLGGIAALLENAPALLRDLQLDKSEPANDAASEVKQ
jgi:hypothetical protein